MSADSSEEIPFLCEAASGEARRTSSVVCGLAYGAAGVAQLYVQHPVAGALALLYTATILWDWRRADLRGAPGVAVTTVLVATGGPTYAVLYLLNLLHLQSWMTLPAGITVGAAALWLHSDTLSAVDIPVVVGVPAVAAVIARRGQERSLAERIRSDVQSEASRQDLNRQLLDLELNIASQIQRALVPSSSERIEGWSSAFAFIPARKVGGDLVWFHRDRTHMSAAVADVAGKGIPAALMVGAVLQLLHRVTHLPLLDRFVDLNRSLCATTPDEISVALSMVEVSSESGAVRCAVAGNPPPLIVRRSGLIEALPAGDLSLGWLTEAQYTVHEAVLDEGDILVLYSDGLTDSVDASGARLEVEGVMGVLGTLDAPSIEDVAARLRQLTDARTGLDDVSFILLQRLG